MKYKLNTNLFLWNCILVVSPQFKCIFVLNVKMVIINIEFIIPQEIYFSKVHTSVKF